MLYSSANGGCAYIPMGSNTHCYEHVVKYSVHIGIVSPRWYVVQMKLKPTPQHASKWGLLFVVACSTVEI